MSTGIKYTGTALPTGSTTNTLFDTTTESPKHLADMTCSTHFTFDIKCSHYGTVKGYKSSDRGTTWVQFYEHSIPGSPTLTDRQDVPIAGLPDFKFEWVNGGTTQTTFSLNMVMWEV